MAEADDLTAQELAFVQAIVIEGKTQVDAYVHAYDTSGYSSRNALRVEACRKANEPRIKVAIAQLRAEGYANAALIAGLTLEQRIADEQAFFAGCIAASAWGAAGQTQDRINKLLGLYTEKVEHSLKDSDPERTLAEISRVAGPELAKALADKHGIPWQEPASEVRH